MLDKSILNFKKKAHTQSLLFNKYAAWKAYAFIIFSSVLYQILIFCTGLNDSFFIFQILLMLEAGTFFAHFVLLFMDRDKKCFINLFVAVSIAIAALSPFLLGYTRLHIGSWDMWAFLYFVVAYPLSYIALSTFAVYNRNTYYKKYIAVSLAILFILLAVVTFCYSMLYGAYQYYVDNFNLSNETDKIEKVKEVLKKRDCAFDGQEFGASYSDLENLLDEINDIVEEK